MVVAAIKQESIEVIEIDDSSSDEVEKKVGNDVIDDDALLQIEPKHFRRLAFPPSCPVVRLRHDPIDGSLDVSFGIVAAAFVDFDTGSHVYELDSGIKCRKEELSFGRDATIWVQLPTRSDRVAGAILNSRHASPGSEAQYSVQIDDTQEQFHCLPAESIKYRLVEIVDTKPSPRLPIPPPQLPNVVMVENQLHRRQISSETLTTQSSKLSSTHEATLHTSTFISSQKATHSSQQTNASPKLKRKRPPLSNMKTIADTKVASKQQRISVARMPPQRQTTSGIDRISGPLATARPRYNRAANVTQMIPKPPYAGGDNNAAATSLGARRHTTRGLSQDIDYKSAEMSEEEKKYVPTVKVLLPKKAKEVQFDEEDETFIEEPGNNTPIKRDIFIPKWADANEVKATLIGKGGVYHKRFIAATKCRFRLCGSMFGRNGPSSTPLYIEVAGRRENVDILTSIILKKVAESAKEKYHMTRMMYDLAIENPSFSVIDGGAAFVRVPPDFEKEEWVCVVPMAYDCHLYSGLFIGRNGVGVKKIRRETDCWVEVRSNNTRRPHILISGQAAASVIGATVMVRERLKQLRVQSRSSPNKTGSLSYLSDSGSE